MFYTDKNTLKAYTKENRIWQGIPGIEVTKSGRIFITFYSGKVSEETGNYVILIKSDNGKDFSEPIAAAFKEDHRCYDPCLWIDPLNRLWFTWACAPNNAVYGVICDDPDAGELKWSDVIKIGNDVMMNKPTVLKNDEWLFPIAVWRTDLLPEFRSAATDRKAFAYLSNDDGKTFSKIGGTAAKDRSFDEHMILELNDGKLAMFIRTFYGIAVSYSYDGGRNWTESVNSGLGGPSSRFHIRRLKSGRILLINHYEYTGRNNLTAFLSDDDGKTWKYKLLLDERNDVSYPDAKEADDGYIYIVYDRERGSFKKSLEEAYACAREIVLAKITEKDIIAGKTVNNGSILKRVVSKLGKYKAEGSNPYKEINRYSDSELAEILTDKSTDDIISILFDNYRISCMNMHNIDNKKLDSFINKIKNNEGSKTRNIQGMINLIRSVEIKEEVDKPIISRVKKFIEDHIEENISVSEIADTMNMSIYYLCHIFKKETSITLMSYKNYIKIERAKELLKTGDMKIGDIADKCGYENSSYFSETFKKTEKISPSAYRDLMRNT